MESGIEKAVRPTEPQERESLTSRYKDKVQEMQTDDNLELNKMTKSSG